MTEQLNQAVRDALPEEAEVDFIPGDERGVWWVVLYKGQKVSFYAVPKKIGDDIEGACVEIAQEVTRFIDNVNAKEVLA